MYGTNGFAQILTLVRNIEAIGQNHSPNIAMAWVRGQDSFYANETSAVSATYFMPSSEVAYSVRASAVKASSTEEQILIDIGEFDDIISERVQDPIALLGAKNSIAVEYASGIVEEVPVTWDTSSFESYYLDREFDDDDNSEMWIGYNYKSEKPEDLTAPQLFIFKGSINLPRNVKNPYNLSTELELEAFVDGLPEKETPFAFPPDGEYDGSLKVTLGCLDDKSADIYYALTLKGIWGETEKYTAPITIELEEGETEPQDFYLIAYNKSNESDDYANSDVMIWHYTINPVDPNNAVAEDGTFRYTLAKTFTLSKDEAVCWRIKSEDITMSTSSIFVEDSEAIDMIAFTVNTESADTVPTKKADITVVSIAGVTKAGAYSLPVQISNDGGKTWTDDSTITFSTSELVEESQNKENSLRSSSGGCNAGLPVLGLGILTLALNFKRKAR